MERLLWPHCEETVCCRNRAGLLRATVALILCAPLLVVIAVVVVGAPNHESVGPGRVTPNDAPRVVKQP